MLGASLIAEAEISAIEASVQAQLDEAVTFAVDSPIPAVEEALRGVYAHTHEGLVF